MLQMLHNHVTMLLQYRQRDEQMEVAAQIIGPEGFPQSQDVAPWELALVPHYKHAEKEEEIGAVGGLQVQVQRRVHQSDEVIEGQELSAHAGLITEEVAFLDSVSRMEPRG